VAIAFFLFHERPELIVYLGGILTVAGTWMVSYKRAGEAEWRILDLMFPLGAAMLASVSQNIRKLGLNSTNEPIIASTITTATSLVCLFSSLMFSRKKDSIQFNRQSLPYYLAAAVFALIGQLCTFIALNGGKFPCAAHQHHAALRHRSDRAVSARRRESQHSGRDRRYLARSRHSGDRRAVADECN
jgi:uncharacterized membrane protein